MSSTDHLSEQLLHIKERTGWSWETVTIEFARVMGERGPSATTVYRYANGMVQRPNTMVERYLVKATQKLRRELS